MTEEFSRSGMSARGQSEIGLIELANVLLRRWRLIVFVPLAVATMVGLWSVTRDRLYVATSSIMPQGNDARIGTAAAFAQQFGVNIGSDVSMFSSDFYVQLIQSRAILRHVVESEYVVEQDDGARRYTLIEHYGLGEATGNVPAWIESVRILGERMTVSRDWDTGLVRFSVAAVQPDLAEQIAARLLEALNLFQINTRQQRAHTEAVFIGDRLDELHSELLAAETSLQEFLRNNREFGSSPELVFEHDRLQRQVMMRQEVYTSLLRSQEQSRIDAVRDTPMFTVIERPEGTAEPESRGTVTLGLLALVLTFGLMATLAAFMEFAQRRKAAQDPHYAELEALASTAWRDLRHPMRWWSRGGPAATSGQGR
jgi:uncharacterized protein involved in exopolysaccharide biosynthesis